METRQAVFAGSWYPAGRQECLSAIEEFVNNPDFPEPEITTPRGGIVPHAGWYFSGALACRVIQALSLKRTIDVVFVFGMHLSQGANRYIMKQGFWETPLGPLEIAKDITQPLIDQYPFSVETARRFTHDNTIELQLPFIKHFHPRAMLVPMGLPPSTESLTVAVTAVTLAVKKGLEACVIGSTDLTHYGPNYDFSPMGKGQKAVEWVREENDRRVIEAMLAMDPERILEEGITRHNACCAGAAAGAIAAGKAMGAKKAQLVSYTTSHDKSPGDSLVGYAGILF